MASEMHVFQDLRLIALLAHYPSTIDRTLVGSIVIGLSIIGGLLMSNAHSLDSIVVDYEHLKRLYGITLLVLTTLIRLVDAFQ